MPLFIRAKSKDYNAAWMNFIVKGKDASFIINPKPKYTSDVIMNKSKLNILFNENIVPASDDFDLSTNCLYSPGSKFCLNLKDYT
jgi:hypothetical protein